MESSKSPVVHDNKTSEHKKSFLTPCRRLGLARRSMPGGLHKVTVTPTRSVESPSAYKSPVPSPSTSTSRITASGSPGSPSLFMKNPSRYGLSRIPSRNLYKRLKSNYPNQQEFSALSHSTVGQDDSNGKAECLESKYQPVSVEEPSKSEGSEEEAASCDTEYEVKDGKLNGQEITPEMIKEVKARIKEKEERVRHLEQMRIYRKKHDPDVLKKLIECWREGCQKAVNALAAELQERGHSISTEELLRQLKIPFELVKFNPDEEDFQ